MRNVAAKYRTHRVVILRSVPSVGWHDVATSPQEIRSPRRPNTDIADEHEQAPEAGTGFL